MSCSEEECSADLLASLVVTLLSEVLHSRHPMVTPGAFCSLADIQGMCQPLTPMYCSSILVLPANNKAGKVTRKGLVRHFREPEFLSRRVKGHRRVVNEA